MPSPAAGHWGKVKGVERLGGELLAKLVMDLALPFLRERVCYERLKRRIMRFGSPLHEKIALEVRECPDSIKHPSRRIRPKALLDCHDR